MMKEIDDFTQLILAELKGNREAVDSLRRDIDEKFDSIRKDMQKVYTSEKELNDIKRWKDKVTEIWSPTQMDEIKKEVQSQKNKWLIVIGVGATIQVLWIIFAVFKDNII